MKLQPNIVDQLASQLSIKTLHFNTLKNQQDNPNYLTLKNYLSQSEISISCDVGLIIPFELINLPKIFINIHPSLLPLYRGPSPIQYVLLNGDTLTGITICLISPEIDKGEIILQKILKIEENENYLTLKERLANLALEAFKDFLKIYQSREMIFFKQSEEKATYTKKIKDTLLDFSNGPEYFHNQVRAFYPNGYLSTIIRNQTKRIKILKTNLVNLNPNVDLFHTDDLFLVYNKRLFINPSIFKTNFKTNQSSLNNKIVEILQLQIEGKKPVDSISFINGYLNLSK